MCLFHMEVRLQEKMSRPLQIQLHSSFPLQKLYTASVERNRQLWFNYIDLDI